MVTQADIISQLDRIKKLDRNYMLPGSYKEFLPSALPVTTEAPDSSPISQRMNQAANYSDSANELMSVQAQNERDYQEMVRAQQAYEAAKKNLKQAEKLQSKMLQAQYTGQPGSVKVRGTRQQGPGGRGNKNAQATTAEGGTINIPPGKFKDQTPFNIGAGLGTFNWNGFNLTVNRTLADNFIGFLSALAKTGYKVTSLGSYANRNIAGTNTKSLHSYGLAIDINPGANPVAYDKVITNLPPNVGRLAARYGLAWGGAWNGSKKDPMHFSKPWFGTK